MKPYFDLEKAEAELRAAYQTAIDQARCEASAKGPASVALVEAQARFIPERILISLTALELCNEQVDGNLVAEALACTVIGIIHNCAGLTPGDRFAECLMIDLQNLMTGNLGGYTNAVCAHTPEPLS